MADQLARVCNQLKDLLSVEVQSFFFVGSKVSCKLYELSLRDLSIDFETYDNCDV